MTKPINEYTADELSAKIQAIKAERERTAAALKRYEEELERRKRDVLLGVPLKDTSLAHHYSDYTFGFMSEESLRVFDGRLKDYVEALQKLAKGEPIDIRVLVPLLKKGWVAMDALGVWRWYQEEPDRGICEWKNYSVVPSERLSAFNIKPAENWEDSLMECGLCTC